SWVPPFADGLEYIWGGMFIESGAAVTLEDCVFDDDVSNDYYQSIGGAVTATDATLGFERCTFSNDFSINDGGAIWCSGSLATLSVLDCDFHNNTARTSGGAIWFQGQAADIERTTFTNNPSDGVGAAISGAFFSAVHSQSS